MNSLTESQNHLLKLSTDDSVCLQSENLKINV